MNTIKNVNLNVKVDSKLKEAADATFKKMGMDTSVAISMFLTRVVEDGEFPFVPKYSKGTKQAILDVEHGKTKKFTSVESLFEDLDNEN